MKYNSGDIVALRLIVKARACIKCYDIAFCCIAGYELLRDYVIPDKLNFFLVAIFTVCVDENLNIICGCSFDF